jgi:hypothetical protein
MTKYVDLVGRRYGKLTVLYRSENHLSKNGNSRVVWHCLCDCGNEVDVMSLNLTRNHTTSCGCARADGRKKLNRDITGERFGHLVGIKKIENANRTKWLFKCDCGNEVEAFLSNVTTGKTQSCGKNCGLKNHPYKDKTNKGYRGDLTGKRFGRLLVLKQLADVDGWTQFLCRCDCGNEKIVKGICLKYGATKSCGCLHKETVRNNNFEELAGQRFGKLTVISLVESKYDKLHWLCRCDCGNETTVSTSGLKSGHTQSCGCYQDEVASNVHLKDLIGRKFGKLTVIERAENSKTGLVRYHCQCECGNITTVINSHLLGGNIQSCGCWAYSRLEECVVEYFKKQEYINSIDYECQKTFQGLTGTGGKLLSYDFIFYINDKPAYLIECQGQQHYNAVDFFGGEEQFERQKMHDELKKEYAESLGIPFIEIPFHLTNDQIEDTLRNLGI